jgi:hypothetical protein
VEGGPQRVLVIGDVDLAGDEPESEVAVRLQAVEARVSASPAVAGVFLRPSATGAPSLVA